MKTCRDDSGQGLVGVIDGANTTFGTNFPMRLDRPIEVYVNGMCRAQNLDNGYDFADSYTVILREAPLPGDTVAVRYNSDALAPGVAFSQPPAPTVTDASFLPPPDVEVIPGLAAPSVTTACPC